MLNLWRLHLLRELSILGTISAVADALGLTRPAVSQQLALLEKEAKTTLFERSPRGAKLTPAGQRLAVRVTDLFEMVEDIETELATRSEDILGELRISAFGSLAAGLVPSVFKELLSKYPRLQLSFNEIESAGGLKAVAARKVDVAIIDEWAGAEAFASSLELHPLCTDYFMAVLPSAHPMAKRKHIRLANLADDLWAVNQAASSYRSFLLNACYAEGFVPREVCSCRNMVATLELIRTAGLVSVLPALGLRSVANDPDFTLMPLRPVMSRKVFIALPKGTGGRPAIEAVISALRSAASDVSGQAWAPSAIFPAHT